MPNVEWILGSILSLSGWRLDILLVRVTSFARVLFVGVAYAISPPVARIESATRMDARTVIDTVGYAVEETEEERANVHDAA